MNTSLPIISHPARHISHRTRRGSISGASRPFRHAGIFGVRRRSRYLATAFLVASLFLGAHRGFAQTDTTHNVVTWEFSTQQGADGKPVLVLHGHILDGWRLYSTTMADSLPNSRITLDSSAGATVQNIDEKGQVRTQKEALFSDAETRSFTGDFQWLVHLQPAAAGTSSASASEIGRAHV